MDMYAKIRLILLTKPTLIQNQGDKTGMNFKQQPSITPSS
jgi:hypothetical protein